jgi:nicotinamidase-related amidase
VIKTSFSCCRDENIMRTLRAAGRRQILLAGIEAHICVYQTAADLIGLGYEVHVVTDAVSSRSVENRAIGLHRIEAVGGALTSVETALFELLGTSEDGRFRDILRIVK